LVPEFGSEASAHWLQSLVQRHLLFDSSVEFRGIYSLIPEFSSEASTNGF